MKHILLLLSLIGCMPTMVVSAMDQPATKKKKTRFAEPPIPLRSSARLAASSNNNDDTEEVDEKRKNKPPKKRQVTAKKRKVTVDSEDEQSSTESSWLVQYFKLIEKSRSTSTSRLQYIKEAAVLMSEHVWGSKRSNKSNLHAAALEGDIDECVQLIREGADVNSQDTSGANPLHAAAVKGHKDVCELLLSNGADVNAQSNAGYTPLRAAAQVGHEDVCELLIESGADVNAQENSGAIPLHIAAQEGHEDVCELLVSKGADVNARENKGATPLHFAAARGHIDVCELLLSKDADVNARGRGRSLTPLHIAASKGHEDVCELLVSKGAIVNAQDKNGATPLELAIVRERMGTCEFLVNKGALASDEKVKLLSQKGRRRGKRLAKIVLERLKSGDGRLLNVSGNQEDTMQKADDGVVIVSKANVHESVNIRQEKDDGFGLDNLNDMELLIQAAVNEILPIRNLLNAIRRNDFSLATNISLEHEWNDDEVQQVTELCNEANNRAPFLNKFLKFIR